MEILGFHWTTMLPLCAFPKVAQTFNMMLMAVSNDQHRTFDQIHWKHSFLFNITDRSKQAFFCFYCSVQIVKPKPKGANWDISDGAAFPTRQMWWRLLARSLQSLCLCVLMRPTESSSHSTGLPLKHPLVLRCPWWRGLSLNSPPVYTWICVFKMLID